MTEIIWEGKYDEDGRKVAPLRDGRKLGEVHLSKGTIDWRPVGAKKVEYRLSWEKFAELMSGHGRL